MKEKLKIVLVGLGQLLIGITLSVVYSNALYLQIAVVIALSIILIWAAFRGDKTKRNDVKKMPFTKIANLQEGLVKIKVKLQAKSLVKSKLTDSSCIGYDYNAMKWFYKRKDGKKKRDRFKVFDSKTECDDFYIYDITGKIAVQAQNICVLSDYNTHKVEDNAIVYTESLLLANQQEYYIIGKIIKQNNKLVLTEHADKGLTIASPKEYSIFYTSMGYRLGCAFFLIILLSIFFWFIISQAFYTQ